MASVQRRFRACLDLDSGLPVSKEEEENQCPGPLQEERLCPDADVCRGSGVCPGGQNEVHSERSPLSQRSHQVQPSVKLQLLSEPLSERDIMNGTVLL